MKNKLITLLIIFTILISFVPIINSTVYAVDYSDSLALIENLGIIGKGEGAGFGTDYLTRNTFSEKLFSLYNLDINSLAYPEKAFYDVSEEDASYPAIMYLYKNGIMRGYQDGSFKPEYFITGIEAVVSFVNFLGYSYKADAEGGYPTGYISTATSLGLLKGLNLDYSYKLNGAEMAKLIDNALTIPMLKLSSVGDNNTYEISENTTILSLYFKLRRETGIITANEFISIRGNKAVENAIVLNGKQLKYTDISYAELVGRNATVIYDNVEENIHNIVHLAVSSKDTSIVFDIKDYIASSQNQFVFDSEDKESVVKASIDAQMFLNNSDLKLTGTLSDFIKNIKDGKITFVSTNENNNYDVIFITEYKYIVADRINQDKFTIFDKVNKNSSVELDNSKKRIFISDISGKPMEFSGIEEGNVLEIVEGTNFKKVTVVNKNVAGNIDFKMSESDYTTYTVSGNEYKITALRAVNYDSIVPGSNVKLYLNSRDEIIHIEKTSLDGYTPAYLIKVGEKTVANEKVLVAKFFDINSNFYTYELKKEFKINNVATSENLTLSELKATLNKYNANTSQLALIKLNENNEVASMYLARAKDELLSGNDDGLCLQHPAKELTYLSGPECFSHKIHVGSLSTPIMIIPKDIEKADDRDFKVVDYTYMYNGMVAYVESYSYSKFALSDEIVVTFSDDSLVQEIDEYVRPVVITSKTTAVTEDGETVTRFRVTDGNKENYFDVEKDTKIKTSSVFGGVTKDYTPFDLEKGDVIRYISDSNNFLQNFEFYYDSDKALFYEKNTKELIGNGLLLRDVEAIDSSWIAFMHGKYSLNAADYIKFNITAKSLNGHIIIVEKKAGGNLLIKTGTIKDVFVGDKVVFQVAGNVLYSIIVIR